jgi:hypothetical protein
MKEEDAWPFFTGLNLNYLFQRIGHPLQRMEERNDRKFNAFNRPFNYYMLQRLGY